MMSLDADYYSRREQAERAAAKGATCAAARRAHQELATRYALLSRGLVAAE